MHSSAFSGLIVLDRVPVSAASGTDPQHKNIIFTWPRVKNRPPKTIVSKNTTLIERLFSVFFYQYTLLTLKMIYLFILVLVYLTKAGFKIKKINKKKIYKK